MATGRKPPHAGGGSSLPARNAFRYWAQNSSRPRSASAAATLAIELPVAGVQNGRVEAARHQQRQESLVHELARRDPEGHIAQPDAGVHAGKRCLMQPIASATAAPCSLPVLMGSRTVHENVVRVQALVGQPVHQANAVSRRSVTLVGRPGRAHAQRDHPGVILFDHRQQRVEPRPARP